MSWLSNLETQAAERIVLDGLESKIKAVASTAGLAEFERLVTIPEHDIAAICAKTGADPAKAEELMRAAAAAYGELAVCLANVQTTGSTSGG